MSFYYVYVLNSQRNGDFYKGFTGNLRKRITEHNSGLVIATKRDCPWKLVYCEVFLDKKDTLIREKYLKSGWGRRFIKKVIKNYLINQGPACHIC